MAMQTHTHSQNLGLPNSSPNYFFMDNNNNLFSNEFNHNNFQHKFLQQHMENQQQHLVHQNNFVFSQSSKKQKLGFNQTTTTTTSEIDNHNSMSFSAQIEKRRHEIDRFINLQNERLKLTLQELRKQQMMAIIKKLEAKAIQLLKQKDYEITQANKKTMELLEVMRKMEFENQTWQKIALENESNVLSLNNTLDQLKQQQQKDCSSKSSNCVDDVESSCNIFDTNKNVIKRNEETTTTTTTRKGELCKVCNSRNVCVLMLPCRHLCCCNVCDGFLDACPLCRSSKMASIEAIFS